MRVTYTKLNTFSQCALRYRFAYIERLPRPPVTTLAFANRVHTVLKRFHTHNRTDGRIDAEKLLQTLDDVWEEAGCAKDPKTRYPDALEVMTRYIERESALRRVPVMVEQKIKTAFGPYTLQGTIDRLDFADDGKYRLIDYKLDKTLPADDAAETSRQLSFYALLVLEGKGLPISEVSLYYLWHGRELTSKRTGVQMQATADWIDTTAGAIRAETAWKPREGSGCASCPFRDECPAKTGKPRPLMGRKGQLDLFGSE